MAKMCNIFLISQLVIILNIYSTTATNSYDEAISLHAMGRPFTLGMLYDANKEQLIPGVTLWDKSTLESSIDTQSQIYTSVKMSSSNSLEDKSSLLDVSASMALSVWDGGITVDGSAKFLNNQKSSASQTNMAFRYSSTTRYDELTMSALDTAQMTYKSVISKLPATHVVTGIMYGNEAVFEFSRTYSSEEDASTISGELQVQVNKWEEFTLDASANLNISDSELASTTDIEVNLFSDFIPDFVPTTYEQALDVYLKIPTVLAEDEYSAVPIKVWLYPLSKLDDNAPKIVNTVDDVTLESFTTIFNNLQDEIVMCEDYKSKVEGIFPTYYDTLDELHDYLSTYKLDLMKTVSDTLASYKAGESGTTAATVQAIISNHDSSPFGSTKLDSIMSMYKVITSALADLSTNFAAIMVDEAEYMNNLMKLDMEQLVTLKVDTDIPIASTFLTNMKNYLDGSTPTDTSYIVPSDMMQYVFDNKATISSFHDFYENNKNSAGLYAMVLEENYDDAKTYFNVQCDGMGTTFTEATFTFPAKPNKPTLSGSNLVWTAVNTGAEYIQYYQVFYKSTEGTTWSDGANTKFREVSVPFTELIEKSDGGITSGGKYKFKIGIKYFNKPYSSAASEESDEIVAP